MYLVTEFPKSGGSWLCQLLSEYLAVPYPRNVRPKAEKSVIHGHMLYHGNYRQAVVMFRDGRDVMASAYFHYLFKNDRNSHALVNKVRSILKFDDYNDVYANMPMFIDFMFNHRIHRFNNFTWGQFVDSWIDKSDVIVKYEDLLEKPVQELERLLARLGIEEINIETLNSAIEKYSFSKQTKRIAGEENIESFIRKGVAGDWKSKFSHEASVIFDKYAGEQLVRAGYEINNNWVNSVD